MFLNSYFYYGNQVKTEDFYKNTLRQSFSKVYANNSLQNLGNIRKIRLYDFPISAFTVDKVSYAGYSHLQFAPGQSRNIVGGAISEVGTEVVDANILRELIIFDSNGSTVPYKISENRLNVHSSSNYEANRLN